MIVGMSTAMAGASYGVMSSSLKPRTNRHTNSAWYRGIARTFQRGGHTVSKVKKRAF